MGRHPDARSTAMGFVTAMVLFLFCFSYRKNLLIAVGIGVGIAVLGLLWIFFSKPLVWIKYTLSGRLDLWTQGLQIILSDKYLLPFGCLSIPFSIF